jgi:hypothetical protein
LSDCLDRLQQDCSLRVDMGNASRERYLAEFSDTKMGEAIAKKYRAIIGEVT